jgi:hypothetical protein
LVDKANAPTNKTTQFESSFSLAAPKQSAPVAASPQRAAAPRSSEEGKDSTQPAWVAFDRKVLRFYGYFKENVTSSADENWRVRKCVLYYYLEDDSLHIAEPKVENSGIPQGNFLKRHRPVTASGESVSTDDFYIGSELTLYGRTYHMVDADEFTRQYFGQAKGVTLGEGVAYPSDAFQSKSENKRTNFNKLMHPHKAFMEASLGKPRGLSIEATQQFLKNDGKVLRFFCVWNDNKMYGEKRPYILHYFLADDTVEVLEVHQANSGRDVFPQLLKRNRLPKNYALDSPSIARIGMQKDPDIEYYSEADLRIGSEVVVFGRHLTICGCDAFTKQFYIETFDFSEFDFPEIDMEDPAEEVPRMDAPPYNGFGSEEDSLGSFLHLMPKVPRKDFKKLNDCAGITLKFLGRFATSRPEDTGRSFVITHYLADDTVSVFEKFQRNSGFVGGKFLERSRLKNAATGGYFAPADFVVGKEVTINGFRYLLEATDQHTQDFMDGNPHLFATAADAYL